MSFLVRFAPLVVVACATVSLAAADAEALAAESEAKCVATAAAKPTPAQIVAKVREAAALVAKDGRAAFPAFRGKDSAFIFGGTYIWIHDMDGVMQMHPVKPKMEKKPLIGLKDANGKAFFVDMNKVAAAGGGWVDYLWPKPGEKEPVLKVSYVVEAKHADGHFVIGCGVYDMTMDEVVQSGAK
jgi:signal transduction histidine kinase